MQGVPFFVDFIKGVVVADEKGVCSRIPGCQADAAERGGDGISEGIGGQIVFEDEVSIALAEPEILAVAEDLSQTGVLGQRQQGFLAQGGSILECPQQGATAVALHVERIDGVVQESVGGFHIAPGFPCGNDRRLFHGFPALGLRGEFKACVPLHGAGSAVGQVEA